MKLSKRLFKKKSLVRLMALYTLQLQMVHEREMVLDMLTTRLRIYK